MSGMNPVLAQLYGTAGDIGNASQAEHEKLAQAQLLDNVLSSHGVAVKDLSDDLILKVAGELFGPNNQIAKMAGEMPPQFAANAEKKKKEEAGEGKEEEKEETSEEKVAEADFLGRVMAHAMWNESKAIEKAAAQQPTQQQTGLQQRVGALLKEAAAAQQVNPQEKLASAVDALGQALQLFREAGLGK